jgi:hypothetical protein
VAAASDAAAPTGIRSERVDPAGLAALAEAYPPVRSPASGHRCAGSPHTRLGDGTLLCWPVLPDAVRHLAGRMPVKRVLALDAERMRPPPAHLARRWAAPDDETFWTWWTRTEVVVKLTDRPVTGILALGPTRNETVELGQRTVYLHTRRADDLVVTSGAATLRPARRPPQSPTRAPTAGPRR